MKVHSGIQKQFDAFGEEYDRLVKDIFDLREQCAKFFKSNEEDLKKYNALNNQQTELMSGKIIPQEVIEERMDRISDIFQMLKQGFPLNELLIGQGKELFNALEEYKEHMQIELKRVDAHYNDVSISHSIIKTLQEELIPLKDKLAFNKKLLAETETNRARAKELYLKLVN